MEHIVVDSDVVVGKLVVDKATDIVDEGTVEYVKADFLDQAVKAVEEA